MPTVASKEIAPFISGSCETGAHENQVKKAANGDTFPTCKGVFGGSFPYVKVTECTCWCHEISRQVRELNPELSEPDTSPAMGAIATPREPHTATLDASVGIDTLPITETVLTTPKTFAPTNSGRKAKGQLEDEVLEVAEKLFVIGGIEVTPILVAGMIDAATPPSTGAITAIFDRWSKLGFATTARSPVRLTGITEDGKKKGLYQMKEESKRHDRMQATKIKRGF